MLGAIVIVAFKPLHMSPFSPPPVSIVQACCFHAADRRTIIIFNAAKNPKYFIRVNAANHFGYTGSVCIEPPSDGVPSISQANQQRIAKAHLL
ncbi:MAG TPA: hypothetical protein VI278_12820 [Nitrososphaeraceae archaeon]